MKNILLLLLVSSLVIGCRRSNQEIQLRIAGADSMAINFFKGDGTMDTVVAFRIIRDQQKINQIAAFIGKQRIEKDYKCGYDGSLHFFKMNQVIQDIDFGMSKKGCMYFSFSMRGKPEATALSDKAKELITSLRR